MKRLAPRVPLLVCLIITLFFSGTSISHAQTKELDSLNQFINSYSLEDDSLANAIARLSYLHNAFDPTEGIKLGERALRLSTKLDYTEGRSRSYNSLGVNYYALGEYESAIANYDSAVYFKEVMGDKRGAMISRVNIGVIEGELKMFDKALQRYETAYSYFEEIEDERIMGAVLVNMAIVHRKMYATTEALRVYILAMELAERSGNRGAMASALSNMGSIYLELNDAEASLDARNRGLVIARETNNRRLESRLLNGLGAAHNVLENYDSALFYHEKALEVAREVGTKSTIATSLAAMGNVYRAQRQYQKALNIYNEALAIRKTQNTKSGHSTIYINIGRVYRSLKMPQKALENFEACLRVSEERGEMQNISNSSTAIARYYESKGDLTTAYRYFKKAKEANDSLDRSKNLMELSALATRYQSEKENQAMLFEQAQQEAALESQLAAERRVRNLIIAGLAAVLILAIVYYRFYRLKTRANNKLEAQNSIISDQKDALSLQAEKLQVVNSQLEMLSEFRTGLTQMIAHDMKNPLNAIIGLSGGQPTERNVKKIAESGYQMLNLVTNMLEVEKLEEASMKPVLKEVFVDELIKKAKSQVEILLQAKSIFLQSLVPKQICMLADEEIMIRVLVNLFTNAIKYSENGGAVRVKHEVLESGFLRISVEDEGPGIDQARLPYIFDKFWQSDQKKSGLAVSTGLGLTFCKLAVESHGGRIWAESEPGKGTRFVFELELNKEACQQFMNLDKREVEERGDLIYNGELALLGDFSARLKALKVHQVGAISKLIKEMDDRNVISRWKQDLQAAVYDGDQQKYNQLIEILEES